MKKQLVMFALAAVLAVNANAATEAITGGDLIAAAQVQAVKAGVVMDAVDMQAAFQQDAQPMQMAALSGQEMKATEGAWRWRNPWKVILAIAIVATCTTLSGGTLATSCTVATF